jgi:hypothetical protein
MCIPRSAKALDFWRSVEYLKALSQVDKVTIMRRSAAFATCVREYGSQDYEGVIHAIVVRFIQPGVPEEINLDSVTREKVSHSRVASGRASLANGCMVDPCSTQRRRLHC